MSATTRLAQRRGSIARIILLAALTAGAVALLAGAATGANVVPNPGFEEDCSGVPCGWSPVTPSATIVRDTTVAHTGSASVRVTSTFEVPDGARACVSADPGDYPMSFWYRATDANVAVVRYVAAFFNTTDCSGDPASLPMLQAQPPSADGEWHELSGTASAPEGTQSVRLFLGVGCSPCSTDGATAWFDDLVFGSPSQATLRVDIPTGNGTVTGPNIDCPGDCSQMYQTSEQVELAAAPIAGGTFLGWGQDCAQFGTEPTCTLTMDSNKSVTASFSGPPMPQCSDGTDNDGDGKTDYPADTGCSSAQDDDETDPPQQQAQCSDQIDNDSDGETDYPSDPGCTSAADDSESPDPPSAQCSDQTDNDQDGRVDYPVDPGCGSAQDATEAPDPEIYVADSSYPEPAADPPVSRAVILADVQGAQGGQIRTVQTHGLQASGTPEVAQIRCGGGEVACYAGTTPGTQVTMRADPKPGYRFERWTGACSGDDSLCTVTATGTQTLGAVFTPAHKRVSVNFRLRHVTIRDVRWVASDGRAKLVVIGSASARARLSVELRRPGGAPLLVRTRSKGPGPFTLAASLRHGKLRRGAALRPGGFVVVVRGRARNAALPSQIRTVAVGAPPEGVVGRVDVSASRNGPRHVGALQVGAKEAWVTFRFFAQPTVEPIEVRWYDNRTNAFLGSRQKANRPTITTGIGAASGLSRGVWRVVLSAHGKPIRTRLVRVG